MNDPRSTALRLGLISLAVMVSGTLLCLPAVGSTRAAGPEVVLRGARIRVSALGRAGGPLTGSLLSLERDTLVMARESVSLTDTLPLASVHTLELSRGRHTHALAGTGVGLLAGALAGAMIGAATYEPSGFFDLGQGFSAAAGAVVVAVPCAAIGLLVGLAGWEQWSQVDPANVRMVRLEAGRRGATVTAAIHF